MKTLEKPRLCSGVSDAELVFRYQNGNETALEILLHRHKDRVLGFIFKMVRNRHLAEDLFQETFFKVISTLKKGQYNDEGKFLPWVLRIAHNLTIDYFRLNRKMPLVNPQRKDDDYDIFDFIKSEEPNASEKIIKEQIHSDVVKLVEYLPEEQKQVLKMRIFGNMRFQEISEETKTSLNTCLGRMRYALINLRKLIDEKKVLLRY